MPEYDTKSYLKQMRLELHKPAIRKFKRTHVVTHGLDDVWGMDIADMNEFKADNDNIIF